MVMGDNSCLRSCGFESWHRILDGHDTFHIDLLLKFYCFLKNGPIPASFSVYFCLFNMLQFKFKFKLKKHTWCSWDLNPRGQNGRRK